MDLSISKNLEIIRAVFSTQAGNPEPHIKEQIAAIGHTLVEGFKDSGKTTSEIKEELEVWAEKYLPEVEQLVVDAVKTELKHNPDYSVTFAVWSGPPGTGKETNIDAMSISCELLHDAYKEKKREIPKSIQQLLKMNTDDKGSIITGTGGMTNVPKGEYEPMFGELSHLIGDLSKKGDFIGDNFISVLLELMIALRISQGFQKIQIDLWPRTKKQIKLYDNLLVRLRVAGVMVYTEMINLRLLTQQEVTAMKENVLIYADKSVEIGKLIKQKLKSPEFIAKVAPLEEMDHHTEAVKIYELADTAVSSLMDEVKNELDAAHNPAVRIIIGEMERAVDRMKARFERTIRKGEVPRADGLPHYQMNRLVIFVTDTSPAFMRASTDHVVDFISSFQSPGDVVAEILESALLKVDKAAFKKEYPVIWKTLLHIASHVADQIVVGEQVNKVPLKDQLLAIIP